MKKQILAISDRAISQIQSLLTNKTSESKAIRVKIKSGGCAGFKYDWSLIENDVDIAADDVIINIESFKLIIDGFSLMYLIGTTLDYKTEIFGSNFVFSNPNSVSTCGCGESFSV